LVGISNRRPAEQLKAAAPEGLFSGESSPIADIDPKQPNVRFGEKQTSAQNSFGFLLIESLTILVLTDNTRADTLPTSSVYAQQPLLMDYCPEKSDSILGVTGGKSSTTRSYKSAALPTELRQPNQIGMDRKPSRLKRGQF
jgi:hypothetical protein